MKASRFNILISPEETPGKSILYNTFHDHRLVIENGELDIHEFFRKIESGQTLTGKEREVADTFLELGILLKKEVNEREIFDTWYVNKIQNAEGRLSLVVLTTMACNLRCPYCFERNELDNSQYMSPDTADKFVSWAKSQVRARNVERLEVIFFGGEPLLNRPILLRIGEALQKFSKAYGIHFEGGVITNGVLLTDSAVKDLRRAGVKWVKVTLDGDAPVHDTTRITAHGKGSFDIIFNNLTHINQNLAAGEEPIALEIGGNFKDDTFAGFYPLVEKLAQASFRPYIRQINIKPVLEVCGGGSAEDPNNPCSHVCFNDKNTARMIDIRAELFKRGLPAVDGLNLGPCDFYRGDSMTIGLNGEIYPCGAFVGKPKAAIGNVVDEQPKVSHLQTHQRWLDAKPWTSACYNCSFLPVCTGGCRVPADANGHSWNSTVCELSYFKRIAGALTKEILQTELCLEEVSGQLAAQSTVVEPSQDSSHVTIESIPAGFVV